MRISNSETDGIYDDDNYNIFPLCKFIIVMILAVIIGIILGSNCEIYYGYGP